MLQHPATDFYDLSTNVKTPPYSPTGLVASIHHNNNNNNNNNLSTTNNNNNLNSSSTSSLEILGQNGSSMGNGSISTTNGNNRETLPSFGFTQEQVACVCEVRNSLSLSL